MEKKLFWDQFDSVVFDLDGTLLNSKREITEKTIQTLEELTRRGKKTMIATGRPWYFTLKEGRFLNTPYLVSCNGALVSNSESKSSISINAIDAKEAREIFMFLTRHRATFIVYLTEEMYGFAEDPEKSSWFKWLTEDNQKRFPSERFQANFLKFSSKEIDFESNPALEFIVILNETDPAAVMVIWEYLREKEQVYPVQSQTYVLDIMPAGINKGVGLKELERAGLIDLKKTVVFGDQNNDISMFEAAAFSVAMGNARDFIKSKATFTTLANDEEGISYFFREYVFEPETCLDVDSDVSLESEQQEKLKNEDKKDDENLDKEICKSYSDGETIDEILAFTEEKTEIITVEAGTDNNHLEDTNLATDFEEKIPGVTNIGEFIKKQNKEKSQAINEPLDSQAFSDLWKKLDIDEDKNDGNCVEKSTNFRSFERLFNLFESFVIKFLATPKLAEFSQKLSDLLEFIDNDSFSENDEEVIEYYLEELEELLESINLLEITNSNLKHLTTIFDKFEELYDRLSFRFSDEMNKNWVDLIDALEEVRLRIESNKGKTKLNKGMENLNINQINSANNLSRDSLLEAKDDLIASLKRENILLRSAVKILNKHFKGNVEDSDFSELEEVLNNQNL